MTTQLAAKQSRDHGFTLMEMLIVIAVIAILIAIAIPLFTAQLASAKNATDQANMRSAYGAATAEVMLHQNDGGAAGTYFFDGSNVTTVAPSKKSGYGQSSEDAAEIWEDAPVPVSGVPNNGTAGYLVIQANSTGVQSMAWSTDASYAGHNITSASQYKSLSKEEKLELDTLLLDSLQDQVRKMSYSDLKALMAKYGISEVKGWGKSCYRIAYSCIDDDSGNVVTSKNDIIVADIFKSAGYNISSDPNNQYVFTSSGLNNVTADDYEVTIWIDAGADINRVNGNDLASNAVVYINDNGKGRHQFNHDKRVEYSSNG